MPPVNKKALSSVIDTTQVNKVNINPKEVGKAVTETINKGIDVGKSAIEGVKKGSAIVSLLNALSKQNDNNPATQPDWGTVVGNAVGNIGVPAVLGGIAGSVGGPAGAAVGAGLGSAFGELTGTATTVLTEILKNIATSDLPDEHKSNLIKTVIDVGIPIAIGAVTLNPKIGIKSLNPTETAKFTEKLLKGAPITSTESKNALKEILKDIPNITDDMLEEISKRLNNLQNFNVGEGFKYPKLAAGIQENDPDAIRNAVKYATEQPIAMFSAQKEAENSINNILNKIYANIQEYSNKTTKDVNIPDGAFQKLINAGVIHPNPTMQGVQLSKEESVFLSLINDAIDPISGKIDLNKLLNNFRSVKYNLANDIPTFTGAPGTYSLLSTVDEILSPFSLKQITPADLAGVKKNLLSSILNTFSPQIIPELSRTPGGYTTLTNTGRLIGTIEPSVSAAERELSDIFLQEKPEKTNIKKSK